MTQISDPVTYDLTVSDNDLHTNYTLSRQTTSLSSSVYCHLNRLGYSHYYCSSIETSDVDYRRESSMWNLSRIRKDKSCILRIVMLRRTLIAVLALWFLSLNLVAATNSTDVLTYYKIVLCFSD